MRYSVPVFSSQEDFSNDGEKYINGQGWQEKWRLSQGKGACPLPRPTVVASRLLFAPLLPFPQVTTKIQATNSGHITEPEQNKQMEPWFLTLTLPRTQILTISLSTIAVWWIPPTLDTLIMAGHCQQPLKQGFGHILLTETGGPGLLITGPQHLQQSWDWPGRDKYQEFECKPSLPSQPPP